MLAAYASTLVTRVGVRRTLVGLAVFLGLLVGAVGLIALMNPQDIREHVPDAATAFTASPWAYDGRIFCLSEDGDTYVIRAGPEFELLATNSLGELCMATPAIVEDGLIIRTGSHVLCVR